MAIKRYSRKEPLVFLYIMLPYIVCMNLLMFGTCIFHSWICFVKSIGTSAAYFFVIYGVFGTVAVQIQKRNAGAGDLFKRIRIMLPVFYVLNIGAVYGAFFLYDRTGVFDCETRHEMVWWTILYGCIMSTLITFINEGMSNWEAWKNSLAESDKLINAYQRSRLLGLKGQINPHFLFNCFNTLSGLIQEDPEAAEDFLDEMTKVHRYLLRGDDEYLVSVEDEMKFVSAYLNLTKARFGEAIRIDIAVAEEQRKLRLPPLSMHVILENIIYTNALNKKEPLSITIRANTFGLSVTHSIHEKTIVRNLNLDEGLDNLITKYRLLGAQEVRIDETPDRRVIMLPLFETEAAVV